MFFKDIKIVLEMILQVECTEPEFPGFGNHQEVVVTGEFP